MFHSSRSLVTMILVCVAPNESSCARTFLAISGRSPESSRTAPIRPPVSSTASFTAYTAGGFDSLAQERLQRAVIGLARSGVFVLLSNSYVPEVRELYARSPDARAAGLAAHTVKARRAINSRASARGTVREYVVTNVRRSPSAAGGFV